MSMPIIIPTLVTRRWQEALAAPNISRWRSLAQMLASMACNAAVHAPESPLADDLRTLADLAYAHQLDMQPQLIEEAA